MSSSGGGHSSGPPKTTWGPEGGGSTFNITNNNNINYNYGSNITAISSEGNVPTFTDIEKKKDAGALGALGSAIGSVTSSEYV